MKNFSPLLFLLFLQFSCLAYELEYAISNIDSTLKLNAFAIVRNENLSIEILSQNLIKEDYKRVVTVLSESGKKIGYNTISYDTDKKITSLNVKIYNALGFKIDEKVKKDFEDISSDPFGTTYSDIRYLFGNFYSKNYPYTIEFTVSYEYNNTYEFSDWYPLTQNYVALEKSTYSVKYPNGYNIRYYEGNFNDKVAKTQTESKITWQLENFQALKEEPFEPFIEEIFPFVLTAPSAFNYSGYEGNMTSWDEFGKFQYQLNINKDILPEEKIQVIKSIADTCKNDMDKVKWLYKYMQSHTRYFNIMEGIGGIQPKSAELVAKTGYGDCKALTNYMKTIMKYAGIPCYYTKINAGEYDYFYVPDFVCHQTNHVILFVPLEKDTIWLECTSQTNPFGYVGSFIDNRPAFIITDNGGMLGKTPAFTKEENRIDRKGEITVLPEGSCKAVVYSIYSGLEYEEKHEVAINDKETQKKLITEDLEIQNFNLDDFTVSSTDGPKPVLTENLTITLNNYCPVAGKRMFLSLNLLSKWTYVPIRLSERKLAIRKKYPFTCTDSITYQLPENYKVETIPENTEFKNKYGAYKSEVKTDGNTVTYYRKVDFNSGTFPASEYNDFQSFFNKIRSADKLTIVLINPS